MSLFVQDFCKQLEFTGQLAHVTEAFGFIGGQFHRSFSVRFIAVFFVHLYEM